jgi:hypothetical protein
VPALYVLPSDQTAHAAIASCAGNQYMPAAMILARTMFWRQCFAFRFIYSSAFSLFGIVQVMT